jgi:hypothetical protein
LNFERFRRGRLRYAPGNVKLFESPGRAGGLPIIIKELFSNMRLVMGVAVIILLSSPVQFAYAVSPESPLSTATQTTTFQNPPGSPEGTVLTKTYNPLTGGATFTYKYPDGSTAVDVITNNSETLKRTNKDGTPGIETIIKK